MKKLIVSLVLILMLVGCTETSDTGDKKTDDITDSQSPVVTLVGEGTITIEVGDSYNDQGATWTDNEDGSGNLTATGTVDESKVGIYTLTYTKEDNAGNKATKTRTVNVVDTTKPVVTLQGSASITVEAGTAFIDPGTTFSDNYDATGIVDIAGTIDTNTLGTYTLKYTAKDSSNNSSEEVTRTVTVTDTTAPVLTVLGDITYQIGQGMPTVSNFITAVDSFEGDVIDSLDYTFTIGDYTSIGSYTLTVTVSDSSGNSSSADVTIDVVTEALVGLNLEEISMLAGLATMFTVTPTDITLANIGESNSVITQIDDLTGNGYMVDEQVINSLTFNTVTAPEYIEIVESYNGSLSNLHSYLAVVLPLLANITDFETEYTYAGFTFEMTKVNEEQYQISIEGTVYSQPVSIEVVIDEMSILGEYIYSINFSTSVATWHYEIVRDLFGIESIVEIKQFLGENHGVVYANGYFIEDTMIKGFMFKDELNITRRMYFELSEFEKAIYYVNDDTGTEKYISLNSDGELVFEYENYSPNVPLVGSEKARWSLDQFTGISTIEFNAGVFGLGDKYTVNDTTDVNESDSFKIEAKNYIIYVYDSSSETYVEETTGNWFLRIEGSFDEDFDDMFLFESFMTNVNGYDVKAQITNLDTNKDTNTLFGINVLEITKEEILTEIQ